MLIQTLKGYIFSKLDTHTACYGSIHVSGCAGKKSASHTRLQLKINSPLLRLNAFKRNLFVWSLFPVPCLAFTSCCLYGNGSCLAFQQTLMGNKCLSVCRRHSPTVGGHSECAPLCLCVREKEKERDWEGDREIICAILSAFVVQAINREQWQCPDTSALLYLPSLASLMSFLATHTHKYARRNGGLFPTWSDSRQLYKHVESRVWLFI